MWHPVFTAINFTQMDLLSYDEIQDYTYLNQTTHCVTWILRRCRLVELWHSVGLLQVALPCHKVILNIKTEWDEIFSYRLDLYSNEAFFWQWWKDSSYTGRPKWQICWRWCWYRIRLLPFQLLYQNLKSIPFCSPRKSGGSATDPWVVCRLMAGVVEGSPGLWALKRTPSIVTELRLPDVFCFRIFVCIFGLPLLMWRWSTCKWLLSLCSSSDAGEKWTAVARCDWLRIWG